MRVPNLDRRVTIEEETAGTWAAIATNPTVWAARKDKTGSDSPRHGRIESARDIIWTIRYRSDVTAANRVNDGSTIYPIRGVQEIGRRLWLDLHTEIVVGDATARGTALITRPGVDTRALDEESGQPIGAAPDPVTVYTGEIFVDERGEAVARMQGGNTDIEGKAVLKIHAEDLTTIFSSETDSISVTWRGRTRTGRILTTSYLESWIHLLVTFDTLAA